MKKIFTLIAMMCVSIALDAQIMKIYKGNEIVAIYTSAQADNVVFEEHEYVDLGLPSGTLWATCNVGADSPEDYGDHFAWGETKGYNSGKTNFSWSTYKWCNGSEYTMTKYCTDSSYGTVDNKTVLEAEDDAATANWGSDWRMPTQAEWKELRDNCTWTLTQLNGVNGYKVISKKSGYTDRFIFLPGAGVRDGTDFHCTGWTGDYWSSSLDTDHNGNALDVFFKSGWHGMAGNIRRCGQSVRAVRTKEHEYVDLGLSVKWATCNIGAESPEDYGDYFAWGETTGYNSGKTNFSESTYKWYNGSYTTITKYCTNSSYGTVDNKTVLDSEDDAAIAIWGSDWRMPTKAEWQELIDNCTWTWTQQSGVNGYLVTPKKSGYTDKSIFLPAAGFRSGTYLYLTGSYVNYWSSSLSTDDNGHAWIVDFTSDRHDLYYYHRYCGRSVRAVRPE